MINYFRIKPFFDLVVGLILFILLLPVMLVLSILVFIKLGRPIFFIQERAGIYGETFRLIKFRTMTIDKEIDGTLKPTMSRLTKFGNYLRSNSLDEIPSLWNVLQGNLSLVGPRPLLPEYTKLYSERYLARLKVKPGITGWAQVNGRNFLSWEEKFEKDIWYIENHSLSLDLKILVMTLREVLQKRGITAKNNQIMPPFLGT